MNLAALVGATDTGSTRLVYAMVIGLALVGLAFIGLGIWLIRRTKVDPEVLAPLERMGESSWKKHDSLTQRRLLDEVRPPGAVPLRSQPAAPTIDREFDEHPSQRPAVSLSDLGPGVLPTKDLTPDEAPRPLDVDSDSVEPDAVDLDAVDLDAVEPDAVEPDAVEPDAVEPDAVDPETGDSDTGDSDVGLSDGELRTEVAVEALDLREAEAPASEAAG